MPRHAVVRPLLGSLETARRALLRGTELLSEAEVGRQLGRWREEEASLRAASRTVARALSSSHDDLAQEAQLEAQLAERFVDAQLKLALSFCQQRRASAADKILSDLGYGYRLSEAVWESRGVDASRSPAGGSVASSPSTLPVSIFEHAVPPHLLQALRSSLIPMNAEFWVQHLYPEVDFFSYYFNLRAEPSNWIEELILAVRPLVEEAYPEVRNALSAEWWMHNKGADSLSGHPLHYDSNEHARKGAGYSYPEVGSVIYLTTPSVGSRASGKTLVLEQARGKTRASRAFLVDPKVGRMLLFKGDLLHGVLPSGPQMEEPSSTTPSQPGSIDLRRLTLMVSWWTKPVEVRSAPAPPPNMRRRPTRSRSSAPSTSHSNGGSTSSTSSRVVLESNMRVPAKPCSYWTWPRTLQGVRPSGHGDPLAVGATDWRPVKLAPAVVEYPWAQVKASAATGSQSSAPSSSAPPDSEAEPVLKLARGKAPSFGLGGVFLREETDADLEAASRVDWAQEVHIPCATK